MTHHFYGRERELRMLTEIADGRAARLIILRGRRRIGKSTLAEEYARSFAKCFFFTGLPPEKGVTEEVQRRHFANELEKQSDLFSLRFDDWDFLFDALARLTKEGRVLIILDEINWMGSLDPAFLGKLKTAWDTKFKKNRELILLLSGSLSAWIEKHILRSTGFFGRINLDIVLPELSLKECNRFWQPHEHTVSATEKFKILGVTGGIPLYLESIQPRLSAEENIRRLCFRKEGLLFQEFDRIFSDVFGKKAISYKNMVLALANGPLDQTSLLESLEMKKSGVYGQELEELVKTGYLQRDFTWSIKTGKNSKLSKYRLSDNYLRFYLRYIEPNRQAILQDREVLPKGWMSIMGLQFENLVLNNRKTLQSLLGIPVEEILSDGPYFQTATQKKKGVQIDYLIQTRFQTLYLCEIKFHPAPVGTEIIEEMVKKYKALALPKGYSVRFVLIHVNGVSEELEERSFFSSVIDFSRLID